MSKVLVDRELLELLRNFTFLHDDGFAGAIRGNIDKTLAAQPAEAEGVERWSELKKLAEKATPGPWWVDSHGHRVSTEDGMQTVFITADKMGPATRHPETGNLSHWPNDWDASYIVNASPDKILELIAALSAVTAERDRLREDAERWRYVSLQGDDTHWLNLLRVDLEDFGGNINAAVDALIDGEAPAMAAKEAGPEHVCSGCGAKGWTGNCLECIPY